MLPSRYLTEASPSWTIRGSPRYDIPSLSGILFSDTPFAATSVVPSIATEYVRNRKQHDNNARHWTELYARPGVSPPSTSPPPSSVGPVPIGSSRLFSIPVLDTQRLFDSIQLRSRSRTSSVPPSQPSTPSVTDTTNEPILIESDREEGPGDDGSPRSAPASLKRKREEPHDDPGRQEKRGRGESELNVAGPSSNASDVIVIEDDD